MTYTTKCVDCDRVLSLEPKNARNTIKNPDGAGYLCPTCKRRRGLPSAPQTIMTPRDSAIHKIQTLLTDAEREALFGDAKLDWMYQG